MRYRTQGGVEYGEEAPSAEDLVGHEAQAPQGDNGLDGLALARVLVRVEALLERAEADGRFAWALERSAGELLRGQKDRIDAAEQKIDEVVRELGPDVELWDEFNNEPANLDHARRLGRRSPGGGLGVSELVYAVQFAATEDRSPRQRSHNKLIADLGARRRSGVRWVTYGALAATRMLRERGYHHDAAWDQLLAFLRDHPSGYLVVATAEAVPE